MSSRRAAGFADVSARIVAFPVRVESAERTRGTR
jgi:hypothetical protein